jgi:3-methyladenine DNA glycosylase Mpg
VSHLYELTGKYLQLAQLAQDPDIPDDALADTIEGLEGEIEIKAEGILKWIANVQGDVQAIDAEIRRLQARKKVLANGQDRLREYLRHNMEVTGIQRIECSLFLISLAKGRDVAVIDNEQELPDAYLVTVPESKRPDKSKILSDLKAGKEIPGASLGKSKTSLRIK